MFETVAGPKVPVLMAKRNHHLKKMEVTKTPRQIIFVTTIFKRLQKFEIIFRTSFALLKGFTEC